MSNPTGALLFIRDVHFNATLRDEYFSAMNAPAPVRAKEVAALVSKSPYRCTPADLGPGWDTLANQSFLGWQSVYTLKPIRSNTGSANTLDHTVVVLENEAGEVTVLFDNKSVKGFTSIIPKPGDLTVHPTINWTSKAPGGSNKNVSLVFTNILPGSNPGAGDRKIDAMIWDETDMRPSSITHSGLDFCSDVSLFEGVYNTLITHPGAKGSNSYPASVSVNTTNPSSPTVDLVLEISKNDVHLGQNLSVKKNEIQWSKASVEADPALQVWHNGNITFGWTYTPPKKTGFMHKTMVAAKLEAHFTGSIWASDINQLVEVQGNIQPKCLCSYILSLWVRRWTFFDRPEDVVKTLDIVVGAAVSAGIFLITSIGIGLAISKIASFVEGLGGAIAAL
ncbi:hypothetical protein GGX14DRAFT_400381 [Mycena pura]|uniref:Uncharacterized protein n=1 Tax=Mycena pura TaxID=153505 RepID=A0AAD6V2S6_9AGAR|nr:hypothetical protein GGX14DRAFT_400381 [Mycena pura]